LRERQERGSEGAWVQVETEANHRNVEEKEDDIEDEEHAPDSVEATETVGHCGNLVSMQWHLRSTEQQDSSRSSITGV